MEIQKFFSILLLSIILYFLPEVFFEDAMFYISGGLMFSFILETFKGFEIENKFLLVMLSWLLLLVGFILILIRVKNRRVKYCLIGIIAFLLYVIDFLFHEILFENFSNYRLFVWMRILAKSVLLSIIVYYSLCCKRSNGNMSVKK